jgi:hypothetical protein
MMLQHFVSRVSSPTLTCCDICILIFHCDLVNVADVEFRCYRHVMLVLCQGGGGEGGLLMSDVARNTGRNIVATWSQHVRGGGRKTPDVGCCTYPRSQHARNTFATRSQHRSLNVARTAVRNMGKALRNIAKVVRNICYASQ